MLLRLAGAQEGPPVTSRAEQIQAARREKSRNLEPDIPPKPERFLNYVKENRIVERLTGGVAGLRIRLGGVATAQGFALGPEYIRRDLANEQVTFRASAIGTTRFGYMLDTEVDMPSLAGDRLFVNLFGGHRNFPQVQYYGPGPDSSLNGRSNYRYEETSFTTRTGFRPMRPLAIGALGSYMAFNTGPGTRTQWAITDQIYNERQAPGIDLQSNFVRGGGFLHFDYRDHPGGPRKGGSYLIQYSTYSDRTWGRYSFDRVEAELQQYISFLNERRVIALRARADVTDPRAGNRVPFYLQPTLGGSNDLRGFRAYRFYDNAAMVLNAEYRWEVFSGMDMAIFGDAGKVAPRWRDLDLSDLEASYGFGMRFNVRNAVFLRIDTAFSHEGFQIWFKFNNVF
jgi:outer membrane protein assembly factor BamA